LNDYSEELMRCTPDDYPMWVETCFVIEEYIVVVIV
jgi:hypothetical protein